MPGASDNPTSLESDPYADWDINIPLIENDEDRAHFLIHDAPEGENHRINITGYDRDRANAVRGKLYHVVHGFVHGAGTKPATLIVFDWLLVPDKLGHRFRQVNIDVTFAVKGPRRGQLPGADLSPYTPTVKAVAPEDLTKSYLSGRDTTEQTGHKLGLDAGYAPFATLKPEISHTTTNVTSRTDFRFIAGYPQISPRSLRNQADSVHWTLQENVPQQSGLPSRVRTAVLLHRRQGDTTGAFTAKVSTNVTVSRVEDAKEKLKDLVGLVPRDDPLTFDPKLVDGIEHGAAVLYANKEDVAAIESPFNKDNLGTERLEKFLIEDDDAMWRVQKVPLLDKDADAEDEITATEGL